jgi:alanyl-tRNA synthetase
LKSEEIRRAFIDFFAERGHRVVPSSSLVPNDPTLLLTNAGMVQFKPYFLRDEEPPYSRAASVQKCLRTTDIDEVGHTARHNTFFEMLGNFSFGDYYKKEAIPWAWELVTDVLAIDPETLWMSVFEEDDEAESIWKGTPGVSPERVIRLGAEDNFWDMGATGPCGPCSEILYDRGEKYACGPDCSAGCDCDRFVELWNLVFMQYNRGPDHSLLPLPKTNIDTGMGLERVAAIKQGVDTIFATDLMIPIVDSITGLSGARLGGSAAADVSIKVVADHARAAAFLISDGVVPANEGRGYILRRLLRRAVRHGRLLGISGIFAEKLSTVVVETLGGVYPELEEHHRLISGVITAEEERFRQTLEQGLELLRGVIEEKRSSGSDTIDGSTVFYLHDTLGFPLEVTREIAGDEGMKVDEGGFEALMEQQRERGRSSREADVYQQNRDELIDFCKEKGTTEFEGYSRLSSKSSVVALTVEEKFVDKAEGEKVVEVILDKTPFYAEMGGQVGDTGEIKGDNGLVEVEDTYYGAPDLIVHRGRLQGTLKVGDAVKVSVNGERRLSIARNHSATHLLHWALRKVLGTHAKQAGSLVTPYELRFDFTHFKQVTSDELREVERLVNLRVLEDQVVRAFETTQQEAKESGAIALFGEKYGEKVRVVKIGTLSQELCGGTHVRRTGQIGPIRIISESGIGAGLRRIEATSGLETMRHWRHSEEQLGETADVLKVKTEEVPRRAVELSSRLKELERDAQAKKSKDAVAVAREIIEVARTTSSGVPRVTAFGEAEVLLARIDGEGERALRNLADILMNEAEAGVVAVAGESAGKAKLVVKVDKKLVEKGLDARELAGAGGAALGGGAGGRKDMAVAGGGRTEGVTESLEEVGKTLREKPEGGT